ncbi:MAG: ubiquinone biosynthesis protein [Gaiellales bacterium]|jgi:predicted unusual protein kinase regulating ubiquinone biosynthesis (AarF/ABC1/UbiB family)/nucleotide-binding universal stress UspA family protein|nr:ubiquinone biosynthesis protein [Gaiellales bacterium]
MVDRRRDSAEQHPINRVLVATDRSPTADHAVEWAADMARNAGAELVLVHVLGQAGGDDERVRAATALLEQEARERAGESGRSIVVVDDDPAAAITRTAAAVAADVLVMGNVGMQGRKEFLLGNIPNRVSHSAPCTVVIVKTAGSDGAVAGAAANGDSLSDEELLRRAVELTVTLTRHLARTRRNTQRGRQSPQDDAEELRLLLEELGPTFTKLGQMLSTRPDLLSPVMIAELSKLQDQVPPLSEGEVVAAMDEALGVPWEDVFSSIDTEPLAAGTIGQVHRATLETGERVVVKVQRPSAGPLIVKDLALLNQFAEAVRDRPAIRDLIDLPLVSANLSGALLRELDFRLEAANIERMRAALAPYSQLAVPRLYPELSSAHLLVMEEVQGVPISEVPEGRAKREAGRQLLESFYSQVMSDGFFHADPHPGNLLWWNDSVYFLDLGMVGELDADVRDLVLLLVLAFWRNDAAFVAEAMLVLAGEGSRTDVDLEALERDFASFLDEFRGLALQDIQLGAMLQGLGRIGARHGVRMPASLTLIGKAFAQVQLATAQLDPELEPFSVVGPYLTRRVLTEVHEHLDPATFAYEAQKLRHRLTRLLDALERAAGARPGANLQIEFRPSASMEQTLDRAVRRLSVALVGGSVIVAWVVSHGLRRRDR